MDDSVVVVGKGRRADKYIAFGYPPNHKLPLKPIDEIKINLDKLSTDVCTIKEDLKIILDHINHAEQQKKSGYWW
tara:strand:+ start:830 stop:1054 length:225 start_codon:yes stop_codon:yes gene_type:complete